MKNYFFLFFIALSTIINAQTTPNFNGYIQQNPIDSRIAMGIIRQQKYDARKDWIQERINQLGSYYNTLYKSLPKKAKQSGNEIKNLSNCWKEIINYTDSIGLIDFADDYEFNKIKKNYQYFEDKLIESYNN